MSLVFASNENNDIYAVSGLLQYKTGKEAIGQSAAENVRIQLGELIFKTNVGVEYLNNVFSGSFNILTFEAQARRQLKATKDVTAIKSFTAEVKAGVLSYESTIETILGETTIGDSFNG